MRRPVLVLSAAVLAATASAVPDADAIPVLPPLAASPNVELVANIPGSYAGLVFKGDHAYATGFATGLTVFDISTPEQPTPVGALALPHFENEDVDLCGDTLIITNDRAEEDLGAVLYSIDISEPSMPVLAGVLPLGLTGSGRGPGHIANFVTPDCSQVWVDGGDDVEVLDLSDPSAPTSLGTFRSWAAFGPDPDSPAAFLVTHDTELDRQGNLWSVGGGGIAGYRLTGDPVNPELLTTSGTDGVNVDFDATNSPYNDFIIHNSQRGRGNVLLVTEEDYVDTDEAQPGSCNGQGKFETWLVGKRPGGTRPLDTWQTELNGFVAGGDAEDSKAPVVVNCSSHWFDHRDGLAAVAWYEQGVRLLDVRNPYDIRQVGYYLPVDGATWAAYWAPNADDIIYTADVSRGIDVLRVNNPDDANAATVEAPIPAQWFGPEGAPSGVDGFRASTLYGWSCVLPE